MIFLEATLSNIWQFNHLKAFSSHYIKVIFKEKACDCGQRTTTVFKKKDFGQLQNSEITERIFLKYQLQIIMIKFCLHSRALLICPYKFIFFFLMDILKHRLYSTILIGIQFTCRAGFRSWWRIGEPGVLQSMGSQRVWHDWVTTLNYQIYTNQFIHGCLRS